MLDQIDPTGLEKKERTLVQQVLFKEVDMFLIDDTDIANIRVWEMAYYSC